MSRQTAAISRSLSTLISPLSRLLSRYKQPALYPAASQLEASTAPATSDPPFGDPPTVRNEFEGFSFVDKIVAELIAQNDCSGLFIAGDHGQQFFRYS